MKGNALRILALLLALILVANVSAKEPTTSYELPIMRPDPATLARWQKEYLEAPRAKIVPEISRKLELAAKYGIETSTDLLGHIDYVATDRNQGACGNCWVWAGTGVAEIAHDVEDGVFDRLSIQYLDSCRAGWACCGGNLGDFANWYNGQGFMIPWSNTNAFFADGGRDCPDGSSLVTCDSISATPQYGLSTISNETIETHTGDATAIDNIKNILNQDRGVYFSFALPHSTAWNNFGDFWWCVGGETEATLWNDVDNWCGDEWNEAPREAGAHAVVIYGYNDDDPNPDNHYWLVLNSWGTAGGGRPNGLYRVPMHLDYGCFYPNDTNGGERYGAFWFETLDIEFSNTPPVADAGGPYEEECEGTTTTVELDGSGSTDLDNDALDFLWDTDCDGGSFDDNTSATPVLTVDTLPGCSVTCDVTVTVTDEHGASDSDTASVTIEDTSQPVLSAPADVTVECDASTNPLNTGFATAVDACCSVPSVTYADVELAGTCPQAKTIERTWTATDDCSNTDSVVQTIEVVDTTPPVLTRPADLTIECDESEHPSNTGYATASDNCDGSPVISYSDFEIPGGCPQEKTILRTWTATDGCGNSSSGVQTIEVVDTTPPVIACNAPPYVTPPQAPITFVVTSTDNCDADPVEVITGYECYMLTKKGKKIDKSESCIVEIAGDSITIHDVGGVGTFIAWDVVATDGCGNAAPQVCEVEVVRYMPDGIP